MGNARYSYGMTLMLGNIFIVGVTALMGLTVGNVIGGELVGFVLMPVAGVLGYKYAREKPE